MEEQKKLKLEDVVTLDKKRLLKEISGNNQFHINVCEPFNELRIEFLNDFSNALRKQKNIYSSIIIFQIKNSCIGCFLECWKY